MVSESKLPEDEEGPLNFEMPAHVSEHVERESPVQVIDIAAYAGLSLDDMARRAVASLLKECDQDEFGEENVRTRLRLPMDRPFTDALQERAEQTIANFPARIERCRERYERQGIHCWNAARQAGYPVRSRPTRIVVTDAFLREALEDEDLRSIDNAYHPSEDGIFIQVDSQNRVLAHEMGHLMSRQDPEGELIVDGFSRIKATPHGLQRSGGNHWLNEGATMLWEDVGTDDGSTIAEVREGGTMEEYVWYRRMTEYLLHETGLPKDILLKAYFGDAAARQFADERSKARFGTDLDGLGCLLQRDGKWAYEVLTGMPQELYIFFTDSAPIREEKRTIAALFPAVRLIEPEEEHS